MPPRILIVDDEASILATMGPLLRGRGYDVTTAMSAKAAFQNVERMEPDAVVLDLGLPDMDGIEVCRLLREERSMPIIVLSARGAEADKSRRSTRVRMTTSPSRSARKNCWRGCALRCGARNRRRQPLVRSSAASSSSIASGTRSPGSATRFI